MQHAKLTDIIAPSVSNVLLGLVVTLFLWYDIFLPLPEVSVINDTVTIGQSPLTLMIDNLFVSSVRLGKIVALCLFLVIAFILLRLNEIFLFIKVRTILPSFFFLITGSLFLPHKFSAEVLVVFFTLLALFSSFKLLTGGRTIYAFNTSLLLLTASLFSFSCVWLLIVFWIFSFITNNFSLKVWLASLLGALVPVLYAIIGFGMGDRLELLQDYVRESFDLFAFRFDFSVSEILYLALIGLLTVISLVHFMRDYSRENVKPRQEFTYIIFVSFVLAALLILSLPDTPLLLAVLILFTSIIVSRLFSLVNNRFTKLLLAAYFAGSFLFIFYNMW
jgi:hypothetical protein